MARILDNKVAPVHKILAEAAKSERAVVLAPRGFGNSGFLPAQE